MFTLNDPGEQKRPIKIWLENEEQVGAECLQQAKNLANLPFLHQWVVLMPDTHAGYGMPIGGVIACEDVIIPNAVGVDIGCGMQFVQTDIPVARLLEIDTPNGKLPQAIAGDILRNIPTGFEHHSKKQICESVASFLEGLSPVERARMPQELLKELADAPYQVGTLGGGNHFIELQVDDRGLLGIMLHSGSRNLGFKICHYFNDLAKEQNQQEHSPIPAEWDLAHLAIDSDLGQDYLRWMHLAMAFAEENRNQMMAKVLTILRRWGGNTPASTTSTCWTLSNAIIIMRPWKNIMEKWFGSIARGPSGPASGSGASSRERWAPTPTWWKERATRKVSCPVRMGRAGG